MSRALRARHRAAGEGGSTLVELLVATVIMGISVLAVLLGMTTTFTSSAVSRQSTNAGIVARDYAEALQVAAAATNAWCSTSYSVSYTPPTGYNVTPTYGACPANDTATPQFQTVSITATAPNGVTETLRIAVREP